MLQVEAAVFKAGFLISYITELRRHRRASRVGARRVDGVDRSNRYARRYIPMAWRKHSKVTQRYYSDRFANDRAIAKGSSAKPSCTRR